MDDRIPDRVLDSRYDMRAPLCSTCSLEQRYRGEQKEVIGFVKKASH